MAWGASILSERRRFWAQFAAAGLIGVSLVLFRWGAGTGLASYVVRYTGYWLTLGLVLGAVWSVWQFFRPSLAGLRVKWQKHRTGWVIAILGAVLWHVHEPHRLRVLFDEYAYAGVAHSMHLHREAAYPSRAHLVNGSVSVLNYGVDKRAVLFPFAISVVHDLTGFRAGNVFIVNGILSLVSTLLAYHVLIAFGQGRRLAWLGQLLWIGLPLLPQVATGGGYDLLNICLVQWWLLAAYYYWNSEKVEGLDLLVLSTLLLVQVRNESVLYLAVTGLFVVLKWQREKKCRLTWLSVLSVYSMVIPVSVNLLFNNVRGMQETAPGQKYFAMENVVGNLSHAVAFLFSPDFESVNSALLAFAGLIALALFLVRLLSSKPWRKFPVQIGNDLLLVAFVAVVLVTNFIMLTSFWGEWTDPLVSRFSLPLQFLFLVMIVKVSSMVLKERVLPLPVIGLLGLYVIVMHLPASSSGAATHKMITSREYVFFEDKLKTKTPGKVLLLGSGYLLPILQGHAAVGADYANMAPWKVQAVIDRGIYPEVWCTGRYHYDFKAKKWKLFGEGISDDFETELVDEMATWHGFKFSIFRVIGVKDKPKAYDEIAKATALTPKTEYEHFLETMNLLP
ncbi:hypothetical protein [Oleiharenicola lentus]|uniref:hypothetical protein n=1 Tax=Oleiharenicola lentus TaxID=2508720 RepID=UPI003F66E16F